MKKVISLLFACLLSLTMSATTLVVVFDATVDVGNGSTTAEPFMIEKDGVTMSVSNGLANGNQYRIYKGQTLTICSAVGPIINIDFHCVAMDNEKYGPGCFVANVGDYAAEGYDGHWSGLSQCVTFTAASNQVRITKIVVTVQIDGVVPPTIRPAGGTYSEPINVSITSVEPEAVIHYTVDGNMPTADSPVYSAPFMLDSDATVQAVAVLDGETSAVSTARYVFNSQGPYVLVDSIKQLKELDDNTRVKFNNPVQVIAQLGYYMWVKDNSDCIQLYGDAGQSYVPGDMIPAGFMGTKTVYQGVVELKELSDFRPAIGYKLLEAEVVTIPELNDDLLSHYLLIKDVTFSYDGANYYITDAEGNTCPLYLRDSNFPAPDYLVGRWDVYVVLSAYRGVYQLIPVNNPVHGFDPFGFGDIYNPGIPNGTKLMFGYDATVLLQYGRYLYARDMTGYALIYGDTQQTYNQGDVIPAGFTATKTTYQDMPELTYPENFMPATGQVELDAEDLELEDIDVFKFCHYVKVAQVMITPNNDSPNGSGILTDGYGDTLNYYDPLGLLRQGVLESGKWYTVYGVVGLYRQQPEFILTRVEGLAPLPLTDVADLSELYDLDMLHPAHFTTPLIAVYQNGPELYVKDAQGYFGLVYGNLENTFNNGDIINDAVCSWSEFDWRRILNPDAATFVSSGSGPAVEPEMLPIEEISRDMEYSYLKFEGVTLVKVDDYGRYRMSDGMEEIRVTWPGTLPKPRRLNFPCTYSGEVTIADVNFLIDVILDEPKFWDGKYDVTGILYVDKYAMSVKALMVTIPDDAYDLNSADLNGDGEINVADLNELIGIIFVE